MQAELGRGRHAEVLTELQRLVLEHPLREQTHALLMLALYRSGRQADALAAYRTARATLVGELGIEPGPRLQQLEAQILRHDPALLPAPQRAGAAPAPAATRGAALAAGRATRPGRPGQAAWPSWSRSRACLRVR